MKSEDLEKATHLFHVIPHFHGDDPAIGAVPIEGLTKRRILVKPCTAGSYARQIERDNPERAGFYITSHEAADAYRSQCRERFEHARAELERAEKPIEVVDEIGDRFSLDSV